MNENDMLMDEIHQRAVMDGQDIVREISDRRQQDTLEHEQDKFNAEMELRRFLWLAEHGNTTVEEVDKVRGCLKTLGVTL